MVANLNRVPKAVLWFKQHYPTIPVVVLRFHTFESFPGVTSSEDPKIGTGFSNTTERSFSQLAGASGR
jgi:hypothetical protein